jgi:hypothetical protein
MAQAIIYNSEAHIIETKFEGKLGLKEAKEIISNIVQVAKENHCFLCLSDYRQAELNLTTSDIYNLPKLLSEITGLEGLSAIVFRRALVVKRNWENFQFFETVTRNTMQNIKLFQDIDEAKKWLLEK